MLILYSATLLNLFIGSSSFCVESYLFILLLHGFFSGCGDGATPRSSALASHCGGSSVVQREL